MGKSSSGRDRTGSEASSKSGRRRRDEEDSSKHPTTTESMTSFTRRKALRRNDYDDDETSKSRTAESRYATSITAEPSEISDRYRDEPRREREDARERENARKGSSRSGGSSKYDKSRGSLSDDDTRNGKRHDSRKSSKSDRKGSTRAYGHDDSSLPQSQLPGEVPSTYSQPYRPSGLAAEYYGDQGESVAFQPGIRPNPPSIVTSAEQAHLMEPTIEARPPPEPSSMGQVGASASYFAGNSNTDSELQSTPSKPSQKHNSGSDKPPRHSKFGSSPRTSPRLDANPSVPFAVGAAAEYYASASGGPSTNAYQTPSRPLAQWQSSPTSYSAPAGFGESQQHSNTALYGGAGLAGAAAGAYMSAHTHHDHSHALQHTSGTNNAAAFANGYPSMQGSQMHQAHRHKNQGLFGRFVDWFRDPEAVAQYEQYTEAIGVCKYCFDPMSSPADAPRRHQYRRRRRSSGNRYGSTTRVDKTYRSSSDEDRKKRSVAKKLVLGGLAGAGAAKIGGAFRQSQVDFDDTYSVKSGRPANQSRVSFQDEPSYAPPSEDIRRTSKGNKSFSKKTSRRRSSSSSSSASSSRGIPRGAALSVVSGVHSGIPSLVNDRPWREATDWKGHRRTRSRSRSPTKKKYFSKRVSPMHSYVDLNTTNSGPGGLVGFFTSPSANEKKGKKPKGLFNLGSASTSSDEDLTYGGGTVRRKISKQRTEEKYDKRDRGSSTAAMMGLVAAGTALAAEADRRKGKGKRSRDTDQDTGRSGRHSSHQEVSMIDHGTPSGHDDEWYDTDGDSESSSSVDLDLAYGAGLSTLQTRSSLVRDKSSKPIYHSRSPGGIHHNKELRPYNEVWGQNTGHGPSIGFSSNEAAFAAGATEGAAGWMTSNVISHQSKSAVSHDDVPPLQELEPRPISDTMFSDMANQYQGRGAPSNIRNFQAIDVSSTSIPLQQPQPIAPVAPFLRETSQALQSDRQTRRKLPRDSDYGRHTRRDSSPAKLPSQDLRHNVNFSLTDEQRQNEQRSRETEVDTKMDRRKSADVALMMGAASKADMSSRDNLAARPRRSSEARRSSSGSHDRVAQIDRELMRLYEEQRQIAEQGRKLKETKPNNIAESVAVGATAALTAAALAGKDSRSGSGEETTPRRKSSLKKAKERDVSPQSESQQERIARMAAQRVRSTPSPVQHDEYSSFFVPTEIREHLKEHNDNAEHRDDIGANVVEIIPGARPKPSHPFDPETYRPFGLELEDDPTLHPWPVPMLRLVAPTPPGSQTQSVQGDVTPTIEPKSPETSADFGEPLGRKASTGSKVTWGEHDTYVYEVPTPEYERSDYLPQSEPRRENPSERRSDVPSPEEEIEEQIAAHEESQADELERQVPFVDARPRVSRAWTVNDNETDNTEHETTVPQPGEKEPGGKKVPHIEIASRYARPPIPPSIVAEPEDLSREPPVSQHEDGSGRQNFYQGPFAETGSSPDTLDDYGPPTLFPAASAMTADTEKSQPGQEDDLTGRSKSVEDDVSDREGFDLSPGERVGNSETRRQELVNSSSEAMKPSPAQETREIEAAIDTPPVPGNDSVFDYPVDNKGDSVPSASILVLGASAVIAADALAKEERQPDNGKASETVEYVDKSPKPKRSITFDNSKSRRSWSSAKADYRSDPEDWERSRDYQKSKKMKSASRSDIGTSTKTSNSPRDQPTGDQAIFEPLRRSFTEEDVLDDDRRSRWASKYSNGDLPDDHRESSSRRKSKDDTRISRNRRDQDFNLDQDDDDSRSVASLGQKKDSRGFFSSLFSSSKGDLSTSSKKSSKSSKSETRAERKRDSRSESRKKRSSKDQDFDDAASAVSEPIRRSRRNSDPSTESFAPKEVSRDQSVDDGFVSAEESAQPPITQLENGEPFLGKRPGMPLPTVMGIPMGADGVSGPTSERNPYVLPSLALEPHVPSKESDRLPPSSESQPPVEDIAGSSQTESSPSLPQYTSSRRLSTIRTGDIPSSPAISSSPTAIPLHFRRPPLSPTNQRFSMTSPVASPGSPLSTPRSRQARPKSTEFRSSKEFRPLYLVERQNFAKSATPEVTEEYPSLPSSRTSSAHPSTEDLRTEAQGQEYADYSTPSRMSAEMFQKRGRSHSYSYWQDDEKRRVSPDYLDSRSATPVPGEAQRTREQEKRPKPKYEFHSPSELLQDPALIGDLSSVEEGARPASPLPSVVSTDVDQDYMSARSRSWSPTRSRSLSRGRRNASRSRSRSTSAVWQDALTAAATGLLAESALDIAAREVPKDSSPDAQPEDVQTPTKTQFAIEGCATYAPIVAPRDKDMDKLQDVSVPELSPRKTDSQMFSSPTTESVSHIYEETVQESAAENGSVADIRQVRHDSEMSADLNPALTVSTTETQRPDNVADHSPHTVESVALMAPADNVTTTTDEPGMPVGPQGVERARDLDEDGAPPFAARSKKSKKDKEKKKKSNAQIVDGELPVKAQGDQRPDGLAETPKDWEAGSAPQPLPLPMIDGDSPFRTGQSSEQLTNLELTQSVPAQEARRPVLAEANPPNYFEEGSKVIEKSADRHLDKLDDQASPKLQVDHRALVDDIPESMAEQPLRTGTDLMETPEAISDDRRTKLGPLEQAFEAAVHARGLSQGATIESAYQAFQPEISAVVGIPLSTIKEEAEMSTPATEKEPAPESETLTTHKPSKKEKRKDKKALKRLSQSGDWLESTSSFSEALHKESPETEQLTSLKPASQLAPDAELSHDIPSDVFESPNPFGHDFEIRPGETDVPTQTGEVESRRPISEMPPAEAMENNVPPGMEDTDWMFASKKGKKDRKDKKKKKKTPANLDVYEPSTENPEECQVTEDSKLKARDINPPGLPAAAQTAIHDAVEESTRAPGLERPPTLPTELVEAQDQDTEVSDARLDRNARAQHVPFVDVSSTIDPTTAACPVGDSADRPATVEALFVEHPAVEILDGSIPTTLGTSTVGNTTVQPPIIETSAVQATEVQTFDAEPPAVEPLAVKASAIKSTEVETPSVETHASEGIPALLESSEPVAEENWSFSSRKTEKDKKRQCESARNIETIESQTPTFHVEEEAPVSESTSRELAPTLTEDVTRLEDSATNIANAPQEVVEEDWNFTPTKTEDKKKKRQITREFTIPNSEIGGLAPKEESGEATVKDSVQTSAIEDSQAVEATQEPSQEASLGATPNDEDYDWAPPPKKKKKKDKKKNRSPTRETTFSESNIARANIQEESAISSVESLIEIPSIEMTSAGESAGDIVHQLTLPTPKDAAEDDWAPKPTKKKDKKKNRKSKLNEVSAPGYDEQEDSKDVGIAEAQDPEFNANETVRESAQGPPEIEPTTRSTDLNVAPFAEPEQISAEQPIPTVAEADQLLPRPAQFIQTPADSQEPVLTPIDAAVSASAEPEQTLIQIAAPIELDTSRAQVLTPEASTVEQPMELVPGQEDSTPLEDGQSKIDITQLSTKTRDGEELVANGANDGLHGVENIDDLGASAKRSKKGKKKNSPVTLDQSTGAEALESPSEGVDLFQVADEAKTEPVEEEWISSKKSKSKKQKKSRQSTFDDEFARTVVANDASITPPDQDRNLGQAKTSDAVEATRGDEMTAETSHIHEKDTPVEEDWSFTTKTRKDKKKKRKTGSEKVAIELDLPERGRSPPLVVEPEALRSPSVAEDAVVSTGKQETGLDERPGFSLAQAEFKSTDQVERQEDALIDAGHVEEPVHPQVVSVDASSLREDATMTSEEPTEGHNAELESKAHEVVADVEQAAIPKENVYSAIPPVADILPASDVPDASATTEQPVIPDATSVNDQPTPSDEVPEQKEESWSIRPKKNKKKKRQSTYEEQAFEPPQTEFANVENKASEPEAEFVPSLTLPDAGDKTSVEAASSETAVEDKLYLSSVQTKKGQKKKKRKSTLGESWMEEQQPTQTYTAASVEESTPKLETNDGVPKAVMSDPVEEQPLVAGSTKGAPKLPSKDVMETLSEPQPIADATELDAKQVIPTAQDPVELAPEMDTDMPNASGETKRESTPTVEEPAPLGTDLPTVKKTKKQKKKSQRQSTFDESFPEQQGVGLQDAEISRALDKVDATPMTDVLPKVDKSATDPPLADVVPEDEWGFSARKQKKKGRKKNLSLVDDAGTSGAETPKSMDQFDSVVQTPFERTTSPEPMENAEPADDTLVEPPETAADDHFAPVTKKKTKAKKAKKRESLLPFSEIDDQGTSNSPTPVVEPEQIHAESLPAQHDLRTPVLLDDRIVSAYNESQVDIPPHKMDIDSTQPVSETSQMQLSSDVEVEAKPADSKVSLPAEHIQDPLSSALQLDATRDEDKANMPSLARGQSAQTHIPREELTESSAVLARDPSVAFLSPSEDEVVADFRTTVPQDDSTDRSLAEHGGNLASDVPFTALQGVEAERGLAETDAEVPPVEDETPKRRKSKKNKKERRVFEFNGTETIAPPNDSFESAETQEREVMETIPEETLETLVTSPQPPELEKLPENVDDMSDVSASTRERRKRRRSPPAWSGEEEPQDLPRNRSLTPPPDHDDIMDTALGIAAGIGFGSGENEATREHPPKPASPVRQPSAGWSFAKLGLVGELARLESNRDSGIQFESPILSTDQFTSQRDSGFIPSPATQHHEFPRSRDNSMDMSLRPPRPQSPTSSTEDVSKPIASRSHKEEQTLLETPRRKPSPVESTSKDRSSALFNSSPAVPTPHLTKIDTSSPEPLVSSPLRRSPSIHGGHHSREELRQKAKVVPEYEHSAQLASDLIDRSAAAGVSHSTFGSGPRDDIDRVFSPAGNSLNTIREDSGEFPSKMKEMHPFAEPPVSLTPRSQASKGNNSSTAGPLVVAGAAGLAAAAAAALTSNSRDSTSAKTLGRSKSRTSSLRNLRGSTNSLSPHDPANFVSGSPQSPIHDQDPANSATRDRDMTDIYVSPPCNYKHASTRSRC